MALTLKSTLILLLLLFINEALVSHKDYSILSIDLDPEMEFMSAVKIDDGFFVSGKEKKKGRYLIDNFAKVYFADVKLNEYRGELFNQEVLLNEGENRFFPSMVANDYLPLTKELFFTTNNPVPDEKDVFKLGFYKAIYRNEKITEVERFHFCDTEYSYMHPTIRPDGLELIFSSDIEGVCQLYSITRPDFNTSWSEPMLIVELDSEYDKILPKFISNNQLSFPQKSINDDLDIFISDRMDGVWGEIKAWEELNSSSDDLGVEMISDTSGLFISRREQNRDRVFFFKINS